MQPSDASAEQLHEAIEQVRAGSPWEAVASGLPAELRPLLESVGRFYSTAPAGDSPRPSFVLGLEEQLRTDLRLRQPPAARARWRGLGSNGSLLAAAAILILALGATRLAGTEPLRGLWRSVQNGLVSMGPWAERRLDGELDAGWRHLNAARALVPGDGRSDAAFGRSLEAMARSYAAAMDIARRSGEARLSARARAEALAALAELEGMLPRCTDAEARQVAATYDAIQRFASDGPQAMWVSPPRSDRISWPLDETTPTMAPTARASVEAPSATWAPSPTPVPPTATLAVASPEPPSPTAIAPTAAATEVAVPPRREKPSPTAEPPSATATPGLANVATPTPTRDDHRLATSTPPPTIVVPITTVEPPSPPPDAATPAPPTRIAPTPATSP